MGGAVRTGPAFLGEGLRKTGATSAPARQDTQKSPWAAHRTPFALLLVLSGCLVPAGLLSTGTSEHLGWRQAPGAPRWLLTPGAARWEFLAWQLCQDRVPPTPVQVPGDSAWLLTTELCQNHLNPA
jgi:hypothetical protein